MPTTTVLGDVKRHLVDRIQADGFTVSWGPPADPERACVYFATATVTNELRPLQEGRQVRNETIDLTCVIQAGLPGDRMAEAEQRALAIYASVEDVVVSQSILAVPGVTGAWISTFTSAAEPEVEGYAGQVVATIHIESRIN